MNEKMRGFYLDLRWAINNAQSTYTDILCSQEAFNSLTVQEMNDLALTMKHISRAEKKSRNIRPYKVK